MGKMNAYATLKTERQRVTLPESAFAWKTMLTAVTGTTVLVVLLCLSETTSPSSHRRLEASTYAKAKEFLKLLHWADGAVRAPDADQIWRLDGLLKLLDKDPGPVQEAIQEKIDSVQLELDASDAKLKNENNSENLQEVVSCQGKLAFFQGLETRLRQGPP